MSPLKVEGAESGPNGKVLSVIIGQIVATRVHYDNVLEFRGQAHQLYGSLATSLRNGVVISNCVPETQEGYVCARYALVIWVNGCLASASKLNLKQGGAHSGTCHGQYFSALSIG